MTLTAGDAKTAERGLGSPFFLPKKRFFLYNKIAYVCLCQGRRGEEAPFVLLGVSLRCPCVMGGSRVGYDGRR
mgnify:CR=1 FL=1